MNTPSRSIEALHENAFVDMMAETPELPQSLGVDQISGRRFSTHSLTDLSPLGVETRNQRIESTLQELRQHEHCALTDGQELTSRILEFWLERGTFGHWRGVEGHAFSFHGSPLIPGEGVQADLPIFLATRHPLRDLEDAQGYIARLACFPDCFAGLVSTIEHQEQLGHRLPHVQIRAVRDELQAFLRKPPSESLLLSAFRERLRGVPDLPPEKAARLAQQALDELERSVYPAYRQLLEHVDGLRERAREGVGIWELSDGEAYYAFLLRSASTLDVEPDAVHELGRREIQSLHAEMHDGFCALGLPKGSVSERCHALDAGAQRSQRGDEQTRRREIVERFELIISETEARIEEIVGLRPDAAVEVRPIPEFAQADRTTGYVPPATDGSRPGFLDLNVRSLLGESDLDDFTICYHEAWPGHHLQIGLAQELDHLPSFRRMVTFDGYVEGWAKYAESIPWEHGLNSDRRWQLSRLRRELISTANLVLDTGIHALRWSREEGRAFLLETTGVSEPFADYIVDRVIATPGQTPAYKLGMLEFQALRDRAGGLLGSAYRPQQFHDMVLKHGSVPLKILNEIVESDVSAAVIQSKDAIAGRCM